MRFLHKCPVERLALLIILPAMVCLPAVVAAQRGGGGGPGTRGGPAGGRGRGPVQKTPGGPVEARFLRVCKVLELTEEQMKQARATYDSMCVSKEKMLKEQQAGAIDSVQVRRKLAEISENFEARFIALLDERQRGRLAQFKEDGILEKEWW